MFKHIDWLQTLMELLFLVGILLAGIGSILLFIEVEAGLTAKWHDYFLAMVAIGAIMLLNSGLIALSFRRQRKNDGIKPMSRL